MQRSENLEPELSIFSPLSTAQRFWYESHISARVGPGADCSLAMAKIAPPASTLNANLVAMNSAALTTVTKANAGDPQIYPSLQFELQLPLSLGGQEKHKSAVTQLQLRVQACSENVGNAPCPPESRYQEMARQVFFAKGNGKTGNRTKRHEAQYAESDFQRSLRHWMRRKLGVAKDSA